MKQVMFSKLIMEQMGPVCETMFAVYHDCKSESSRKASRLYNGDITTGLSSWNKIMVIQLFYHHKLCTYSKITFSGLCFYVQSQIVLNKMHAMKCLNILS